MRADALLLDSGGATLKEAVPTLIGKFKIHLGRVMQHICVFTTAWLPELIAYLGAHTWREAGRSSCILQRRRLHSWTIMGLQGAVCK